MTRMSGSTPKPWVKSWRGGSPKWLSLPLTTRGLARELWTYADNSGRIELPGDGDPRPALWRLVGAHPRERQTLGEHLDKLIANGTVTVEPGLVCFPNFLAYQSRARPQAGHKQSASGAQAERNQDASGAQAEDKQGASQNEPNSPEPLKLSLTEEEGEEEVDGDTDTEGEKSAPLVPVRDQIRALESRYPAALVAEVHAVCASKRDTKRMSDNVWLKYLRLYDTRPADVVIRAMMIFVEKYSEDENDRKAERYLWGIVRGEAKSVAKPRQGRLPPGDGSGFDEGDLLDGRVGYG